MLIELPYVNQENNLKMFEEISGTNRLRKIFSILVLTGYNSLLLADTIRLCEGRSSLIYQTIEKFF